MSALMQAARQMDLSPDAVARLHAEMTPQSAVRELLDAGMTTDALKLLARLLPKRYAVAWLCQCARGQALDGEALAGASLAEKWVRDPSEGNRRAAFEFATTGGYQSLGAWLAASAGWAGGSLAPATQATPVPPADHLTARAAVAVINLLAALVADAFEARRVAFIGHAMNLLETERAGA
ncbi:DUF6931 family protein [Dyella japonica]|uniref:Uncharacterized protein n=1 Tax=Dyella japonica A8 TaxID=1217721 RepID=A0A075K1I4_9GAMM|nr:hypothetical protein [Dyella japonica]AIF48226.1 hypothetical protein HY57_13690 [Dyella japonica A8]